MIELVYASRFIQQLREETHGTYRQAQAPCSLAADLCATAPARAAPPARRALRLVRPLAAALGAIALLVVAAIR